jgi:hypothetical protein
VVVSLARESGSSVEDVMVGVVMVGVEQWAEIRCLYFVKRLSIKEIVRRTGHGRTTIRRAALASGRVIGALGGRRSSIPSGTRCMGCCGRTGGAGQGDSRAARGAGLRGLEDDPASSTSGSDRARTPSAAARPGAVTSSSAACPIRVQALDAGVLEVGARPPARDRPLPPPAGRAPGDAGVGPRGRAAPRAGTG